MKRTRTDTTRETDRALPPGAAAILAAALFAWGIAMRAVEVISGNYLFGFDHGRDYLAAYSLAVTHKLTLIGAEVGAGSAGLSGLFHGPGYFYLIALMYLLFRGDPYGGLVLMFVFGVAALALTFVTVRKMFGIIPALTALFLVGVSPLIAPQSRFIWNHHPSSFFIVIVLYLVYRIQTRPRLFAPLAVFTAGIIYNFELAIAVPMVLSVLLAIPVVYRVKDFRTYVLSMLSAVAAFLPMGLFEIRHNFIAVRGFLSYVIGSTGSPRGIPLLRLSDHAASYLGSARNSFVIESGFLPVWVITGLVAALILSMVLFASHARKPETRRFFGFSLLLIAVTYGMFLLLDNTVWDYYLIHLHFVYMYAFAVTAGYLTSHWHTGIHAKAGTAAIAVLLISMAKGSYRRMVLNYTVDFHDYGGVEKIIGKRAVIDQVYREAAGRPFNVRVFMAPIYTYPYDYLFLTYGKQKYGYHPGSLLQGDVYLIIEPDSKYWYKGWLDTVVNGGTVVRTERLPTGHIVIHKFFGN